jgi:hypothetical protein
VRSERVFLDAHGFLRFQFIQARHGNLRVLLQGALHRLPQIHGMHLGAQSG